MAKRSRPPVLMKKTRSGWQPAYAYDAEQLDEYPLGAEVEFMPRMRRSDPNHRHFFACLHRAVESGAVPYYTTEGLREALLIDFGWVDYVRRLDGSRVIKARSMDYASMDEATFKRFKEFAGMRCAELYGIDLYEDDRALEAAE